jgi:hypothetical protein
MGSTFGSAELADRVDGTGSLTFFVADRRACRLPAGRGLGVATMLAGGVRRRWSRRRVVPLLAPDGSDLARDLGHVAAEGRPVATYGRRRRGTPVNLFVDNAHSRTTERIVYVADGSRCLVLPYHRQQPAAA